MEKENLMSTTKYFKDSEVYFMLMEKYNPDNALLEPFYVKAEERLKQRAFETIAEYKDIDIQDVIGQYGDALKFCWEGTGCYDLHCIHDGIENGVVTRIENIMNHEVYDMDLKKLFNPKLIEQEYGGKVYAVFESIINKWPIEYKIKSIIVDDLNNDEINLIRSMFSIVEEYKIRSQVYDASFNSN